MYEKLSIIEGTNMLKDMSNYDHDLILLSCSIVGTICAIFDGKNMMSHLNYDQTFTFEADPLRHIVGE